MCSALMLEQHHIQFNSMLMFSSTIADNTPNKIGSKYLSLRQKLAGENNINKAPVRTEQLSNGRQASGKKAKGAHGRLHNSNKLWRH
jgi:hypothetical protein